VPLSGRVTRPIRRHDRQQAAIISDTIVKLGSRHRDRLPIPLRRIVLRRDNGRGLTLLTD